MRLARLLSAAAGRRQAHASPRARLPPQIAQTVLARPEEFTAQNFCNVLWGYAKLGVAHEPLLALGVKFGLRHMADFAPQSVSNLTWSFVTLGYQPGDRWATGGCDGSRQLESPCRVLL